MKRIVIIEDNDNLAFGLRTKLELEGYSVAVAADGLKGLDLIREQDPQLVVLDLLLPQLDGYNVLKRLREQGSDVPVILLTALSEETDKVLGFRLGADDYVTKPFGLLELIARIQAVLRRASPPRGTMEPALPERFGDVEVNFAARSVTRAGQPVGLSPKAFDLLSALIQCDGVVMSRLDLLHDVWGHRGAVLTRTVDIHIAELRRKLEHDPANPRHIVTVWKAGYRFQRA